VSSLREAVRRNPVVTSESHAVATVGDLVLEGERRLRSSGADDGRLESELLLGHALRASRLKLHLSWRDSVDGEAAARYRVLLTEREAGKPVQYVLGEAAFRELDLRVNENVLIPRPETETLVELALRRHRAGEIPRGPWVDVGTGSGAIALSLALEQPDIPIVAVELSAEALFIARRNRELLGCANCCRLVRGTLLAAFRAGSLAAVVSNPPYVSHKARLHLPREIRAYEPNLALDGGVSGLKIAYQLGLQAATVLAPGGMLLMELGDEQPERLATVLRRGGWPGVIDTSSDLTGRTRYLTAVKGT
jgi:release factor glutamine methyltransferase